MDVRKVAKLAHLEITEEEVALYTPQMANIVAYVEQLNELDTENIEPAIGGLTPEGEADGNRARRCAARIARTEKRARGSTFGGGRSFPGPEGFMIFKFQISNFKFQIAGMVVVSAFFSFSCSIPNLEQAECTESRGVVKKFYSFHFAKDLKLDERRLKRS